MSKPSNLAVNNYPVRPTVHPVWHDVRNWWNERICEGWPFACAYMFQEDRDYKRVMADGWPAAVNLELMGVDFQAATGIKLSRAITFSCRPSVVVPV